jgi:hypothetical protein
MGEHSPGAQNRVLTSVYPEMLKLADQRSRTHVIPPRISCFQLDWIGLFMVFGLWSHPMLHEVMYHKFIP